MRKSIKSFIAIFVLLVGILQVPTTIFAKVTIPTATSDFYVNDFAGVFSDDEKQRLMDKAVALSDEHDGIQVVVTTVKSLDGNDIESYALEMYNQYGIGKNDMGLLILLSTGDRQIRVEVGLAMEAYINDSKAGRFIDKYAIPSLKEDRFNEGLINLQEAFIKEIIASIESESQSGNTSNVQSSNSESNFDFLSILGTLLFICVGAGIIILIVILVRKIIDKATEKKQTIELLTKQLEECQEDTIRIRERADRDMDTLRQQSYDLSAKNNILASEYQELNKQYNILKDRYERVQILYPTADKDVTAMIEEENRQRDMAIARKADDIIQAVIILPASKDIVSELSEAKSCYSRLTEDQKSYVESDINKLNQLYDESLRLKQEYDRMMEEERKKKLAAVALASITAIISCITIGKARHLRKLKEAKSIYDNLDSGVRSYFDQSIADKLDKLYREAKRDKEREDEEERRRKRREEEERRRRMQSSSSSFGSSSRHSGFGGRSGGGGASRGF